METQVISVHPATWQIDLTTCEEENQGLTVEPVSVQTTLILQQHQVRQ